MEWVSEQRAHSIGLAAAAVLVEPLVRVLSSAISSTMCAASENTAAVTMPARWWESSLQRRVGTRMCARRWRWVSV